MTIYEAVKEWLLPDISKWESHLITIGIAVLLAVFISYYLLRKQNRLLKEISETKQQTDSAMRLLASIIDSTDDAILSIGSDGRIISYNQGAERIFGISAERMLDHPLSELIPPEIPDRTDELIMEVGRGRNITHNQGVFIRSDGTRIHLSVTATPIPDFNDHSGCFSLIAHDISDQIAKVEMLNLLNLKHHLLTAITRHDINNSLMILMGYCSFLEDSISDPEISRIVSKIKTQSDIIQDQVQFMEAYESLGVTLPAWQRAEEVFNHAVASLKREHDIFEVSLADLEVYADPLIERVIYNLCDNSLKYGEKLTRIRTRFVREGEICRWIIEDDGVGILPDLKEKIFESGFGKTSGLGLYLTKQILMITNITIEETGIPSEGARFEMIIPAGRWRMGTTDSPGRIRIQG
jgi:PAS domain S-box-containing protein